MNTELEANVLVDSPQNEDQISNAIFEIYKGINSESIDKFSRWTLMAFELTEWPSKTSPWGTCYGPKNIFKYEVGKNTEYPQMSLITNEVISFWLNRSQEVSSCLFKQRYSDLIWDLGRRLGNIKPRVDIALRTVDSKLRTASLHGIQSPLDGFRWIERALEIALAIGDVSQVKRSADTLLAFEKDVGSDRNAGLWGHCFDYLVLPKKPFMSQQEIKSIVSEMEFRAVRMAKEKEIETDKLKLAIDRLVNYHTRQRDKKSANRWRLLLADSLLSSSRDKPSYISHHLHQQARQVFLEGGFKKQAEELETTIAEISRKIIQTSKYSLQSIGLPDPEFRIIDFSRESLNLEQALSLLAKCFIPSQHHASVAVNSQKQAFPLSSIFPKALFDYSGRLIARIVPNDENSSGLLIETTGKIITAGSQPLNSSLESLKSTFKLDPEAIISSWNLSHLKLDEHLPTLRRGIQAYLDSDWISALHILPVQFEVITRAISLYFGLSTIKVKDGIENVRLLDELLRNVALDEVLSPDTTSYFRALYTDTRGINVRNCIYHGLWPASNLNKFIAQRVFHTLNILGSLDVG